MCFKMSYCDVSPPSLLLGQNRSNMRANNLLTLAAFSFVKVDLLKPELKDASW